MKKILVLLVLSVCLIGCSNSNNRKSGTFIEVCSADTCDNYVKRIDIREQIDKQEYVRVCDCGGCPTSPGYLHYLYYIR